ncbi:MAG: DNA polymerase/3'-5' exonuclease PolX, partial [Dehalococcoidales bacterium]|nr:DNA polymerase/3'-5' exonuclease PolX [Dehalococcoidales bacterium]
GGQMGNRDVADLLENIANLLEIRGENPYRVRAYREAGRHIANMAEDINKVAEAGRLQDIPGVGESIANKIREFLTTGRLAYYEDLKRQVAPGVSQLLEVPGLGPRKAQEINRALGITSIAELEKAAREHKLSKLPGIREKTEQKILREIERLQQRTRRILLGVALPAAEEVVNLLKVHPQVQRIDPAGSIRRMKETIGDIDVLVASTKPVEVMDALCSLRIVKEVLAKGTTKSSILTRANLQIDVRVIHPDEYGSALQYFTGSKDHNIALRDIAIRKGLKLNEYGIFDVKTGRRLGGETEEQVYHILGLRWMPPELRENRGEIEAAAKGKLPKLIEIGDIRGDLHVHTDWSDGTDSLDDMVEAALERGYEYVAITDHSIGLGVARGLSVERIREQRRIVDQLNRKYAPFMILHGIEVNIRGDGTLDYDDEVLAEFDIVTASIHSGFGQPREKITARIIRAMQNPNVDAFNHPRGRLIGKREGYAVDLEAVIREGAKRGVAIEINSQPDRMDLDDVWARRAKELGATLVIDTDSHSKGQLDFIRYGVAVARRGWLERSDVLNALSLKDLLKRLHPARMAA